MTKSNSLLAYAVLSSVVAAQIASAQFVTNTVQNSQGMGVKVTLAGPTYSQTGNTAPYKAYARLNGTTDIGKLWIQFDLSNAWATYGQANLASATLTLWGENGNARSFSVSGLNDNAGLEGWNMSTLSWLNAPGNVTTDNTFDPTKTTILWPGSVGVNLPTNSAAPVYLGTDYDQCARYTSDDLSAFLATDSDGKVTFMLSGGNNQNWWVGVGGIYDVTSPQYFTADGQVLRDSPTLTLVFTTSSVTVNVPVFTNVMRVGNNLILQGKNGPANGVYQIVRTDDLTDSVDAWPGIGIQNFAANGNFSFTSEMPADAASLYRLQVLSSDPVIAPGITTEPQGVNIGVGNTANFSVAATGTAPMTYRWYFNTNTLLQSGLTAALTIPNAQVTNSGIISVTVSNLAGSTNSVLAVLSVTNSTEPARIMTQPPSLLTANVGQSVNFSVTAAGALPLGYQWYFNTNTVLAGQTNPALTLNNLQLTNAGMYSVTVTNPYGTTNSLFTTLAVSSTAGSELIGWASVAGLGMTNTTGGGTATPILATNIAQLKSLASDSTPRVILLSGTYATGSSPITIANNKTLRGVDPNVVIQGGIDINAKSNIIVQNVAIRGSGWTKTIVNGTNVYAQTFPVDTAAARASHHLWFDHVSFSDASDGNLDLTIGSDYITVSWCKFYYTPGSNDVHRLCSLVGNSSTASATDTGKNNVTYHHNWFSTLVDQRMPRLLFGKGHMFNNYYYAPNNGYCIGTGSWGSALVENNYFKNVKNPHQAQDGNPSYIVANGNFYDNTTGNKQTGLLNPDASGNPGPWTPPYSYTLDPATSVPSLVTLGAGPQ